MLGMLFAAACWGVWYLSAHYAGLLAFDRDAIIHAEWWRLWSAHLTHAHHTALLLNSVLIAVAGLVVARFTRMWLLLLALLIAMPVMTGLLLMLMPELLLYRGASGVAAFMVMLAVWFLIVESPRFSLGYWLGVLLLLLFIAKVAMEGLMLLDTATQRMAGLQAAWLVQFIGSLLGLVFFNGLHQSYVTRTGDNVQYRGPYAEQPSRPVPAKLNGRAPRRS